MFLLGELPNYENIGKRKKLSSYLALCILIKHKFLLFFTFPIIISYFWTSSLDYFHPFLFPNYSNVLGVFLLCIPFFLSYTFSLISSVSAKPDCSFYSHTSTWSFHFNFFKGHTFQKLNYCALEPGFLFLFLCNIVYFWS